FHSSFSLSSFFFYSSGDHPHLHSFPTRRSSDLTRDQFAIGISYVDRDITRCAKALSTHRQKVTVQCQAVGQKTQLTDAAKHIRRDRKSTRLNSSHRTISYAVFCLKKKNKKKKKH